MTAMEEMELWFKSGNNIPVERAFIKKELFDRVKAEYDEILHQRNVLGQAIGEAAVRVGIINGEVPLDGPQLLMVLEELTEAAWKYNDLAD